MMKRIVSLTVAVLLIAALFVGCSSGPEGTYKVKTIDGEEYSTYVDMIVGVMTAFGGDELKVDADQMKSLLEKAGSFTLKADGVVESFDVDEENWTETTKTGTWKLDGEKLTITVDGKTMEGTLKDGEITITEKDEDTGTTHTMVLGK